MKRFSRSSFRWSLTALVLVLALPLVVFADQVVNTIDTTIDPALEIKTITAGGSGTVGFYIQPSNTIPPGDATGCNSTGANPATVTLSVPAGVTASPSSLTFTGCGIVQNVSFSSSTAGSYTISVASVTGGKSGSLWDTAPAAFTLIVNAPADTTPPVIVPTVSPAPNANGWNNTDVTVSWSVSDPESGIASSSGCGTTTLTTETAGTTLTCSATNGAGLSNSASVTVKIDKTAPNAPTANVSPAPNAAGWNKADVTVSFASNGDAGAVQSGVAGCTDPTSLTSETAGTVVSGTCTDVAGNTSTSASVTVKIDKTAPTITWNGGPAAGGSYYFGFVPAEPTCSASDSLSGPNGCTVTGYGTTVGSHTMTATAYDVAGNSKAETRSYEVKAWEMYGFYQPVDMTPAGQPTVWNTVKSGSTVPLKFEVFAGSLEFTDPSVIVQPLQASRVSCNPGTDDAIEELAAAGNTVLRYDFTDGQFIYNWKTPKSPGTCYKVTVSSMSGSSLTASFKLK